MSGPAEVVPEGDGQLMEEPLMLSDEEQVLGSAVRAGGASRGIAVGLLATALLTVAVMAAPQILSRRSTSPVRTGLSTVEFAAIEKASDKDGADKDGADKDGDVEKKPEADKKANAPKPCKTQHVDDKPSMFCWAVMFEDDKNLIKSQFSGRSGMFACNDYMVIGTEDMVIGKDDCGVEKKVVKKTLPKVSKGTYGVNAMTSSWLNVPIFLKCWDTVIESGKVWERDFTVKVDPDTVFFPGRLGYHLKDHVGKPIYTTDCRYWGGDPVGKLFGSLEVLSKQAVGSYKGNKQTCHDLGWQGWGEDYWLQHCMDAIQVPHVILADYVTDGTCPEGGYADCGDQKWIALHPYKDAGQWWECWKKSNGE